MADAMPRSAVGNHAATMRLLAGKDGASAAPSPSRRPNSAVAAARAVPSSPTPAWKIVKADQPSRLHW